jgi:hypothetical protein
MAETMTQAPSTESASEEAPVYAIDLTQFEAGGESFWTVVSSRFCRSCQRKYGVAGAPEKPAGKRGAKAAKDKGQGDPLEIIQSCCSRTNSYLDSALPIAEAMFRVLLARCNRPTSVEEMRTGLESWAAQGERRRDVSARTIQRILDNASFYSIKRVGSAAK